VRFCRNIKVEVRRNNARLVTFELSIIDLALQFQLRTLRGYVNSVEIVWLK